jgi:hypothetical protein
MRRYLNLIITLVSVPCAGAQVLDWQVPSAYRTAANNLYWKNRPPSPGYWQQDVHYKIKAVLNDSAERIDGKLELLYYNNSPDTLRRVFFHLYQNAFQPGSYLDKLYASNKEKPQWGKYEAAGLGTKIHQAKCSRPADLMGTEYEMNAILDNTIVRFNLPPHMHIAPGDSLRFRMDFSTWFDRGSVRRRMKVYDVDSGYKHFNTVHWYPRISVYDHKFGWDVQQHMEHEFYGNFGTYDVELDLPAQYITEATGTLLNPEQVYKGDLRKRVDISRYTSEEIAAREPLLLDNPKNRKIWRWHAENVHDFAWTCDPTYRIMEVEWEGVKCVAIAEQRNAPYWQKTADFVAFVIKTYSRDFGAYAYPKMVAADARDGMEYPMLTLDGGRWPGHQGLIAHEVGHNWFFGMLGNNETYRASLDEGFTQFLTSWCLRRYRNQFFHPNNVDDATVYGRYLLDAMDRVDPILNTHSDDFNGALGHGGGYSHVYMKTATMLYNLEYVLGSELFLNAMKHYFEKWKICHPYVEDFRAAITEYTKVDLVWFFDQWFETTKVCDYSVRKVKKLSKDTYAITIRRKEEMQMPIDLLVQHKNGNNIMHLIPNTYFTKRYNNAYEASRHKVSGLVFEKTWTGWSNINRDYTIEVQSATGIANVIIDPSRRLADVYRPDNAWKKNTMFFMDKGRDKSINLHQYVLWWRPDVWYNAVDMAKAGLHISGDYAKRKHRLDAWAWMNTAPLFSPNDGDDVRNTFSMSVKYANRVGRLGEWYVRNDWLDGLHLAEAGVSKTWGNEYAYAFYRYMQRWDQRYVFGGDLSGQFGELPGWWPVSRWDEARNASLNLGIKHQYKYVRGNGNIHLFTRGGGLFTDRQYSWAGLEAINRNKLGKATLNTRFFAQLSQGDLPGESALYLAGDNPENMWNNSKFTRADWGGGDGRLGMPGLWWQQGGGLNLRGFVNSLTTVLRGDSVVSLLRGNNGISASAELDLDRYIPLKPKFTRNWLRANLYLFTDAGMMWARNQGRELAPQLLANAGVGTAFTISRWFGRSGVQPLTLRFDLPLLRNITPDGKPGLWNNPFLVFGVNRSF